MSSYYQLAKTSVINTYNTMAEKFKEGYDSAKKGQKKVQSEATNNGNVDSSYDTDVLKHFRMAKEMSRWDEAKFAKYRRPFFCRSTQFEEWSATVERNCYHHKGTYLPDKPKFADEEMAKLGAMNAESRLSLWKETAESAEGGAKKSIEQLYATHYTIYEHLREDPSTAGSLYTEFIPFLDTYENNAFLRLQRQRDELCQLLPSLTNWKPVVWNIYCAQITEIANVDVKGDSELSFRQVCDMLLDDSIAMFGGKTAPLHKPNSELVRNIAKSFAFVLDSVVKGQQLDFEFVQTVHKRLVVSKKEEVYLSKSSQAGRLNSWDGDAKSDALRRMLQWITLMMDGWKMAEPITISAVAHLCIYQLQAFSEFNTRVAQLVAQYILLQGGFPPLRINPNPNSLRNYRDFLQTRDPRKFVLWTTEAIKKTMELFINEAEKQACVKKQSLSSVTGEHIELQQGELEKQLRDVSIESGASGVQSARTNRSKKSSATASSKSLEFRRGFSPCRRTPQTSSGSCEPLVDDESIPFAQNSSIVNTSLLSGQSGDLLTKSLLNEEQQQAEDNDSLFNAACADNNISPIVDTSLLSGQSGNLLAKTLLNEEQQQAEDNDSVFNALCADNNISSIVDTSLLSGQSGDLLTKSLLNEEQQQAEDNDSVFNAPCADNNTAASQSFTGGGDTSASSKDIRRRFREGIGRISSEPAEPIGVAAIIKAVIASKCGKDADILNWNDEAFRRICKEEREKNEEAREPVGWARIFQAAIAEYNPELLRYDTL